MADSFKKTTLKELNRIADDPTIPQNLRELADNFGNRIAEVPEEDVKKYLWANLTNAGLAYRSLLNYMPEESSKVREFVLGEQKPKYSAPDAEKIGEMFKESGGKSILDQSSPNFFGYNTSIDRAKVRAVAKANGMTEEELWKAMREESAKMERDAIASGLREEGWARVGTKALGFLFPRTMELVREGKGSKEDIDKPVLDLLENGLFLVNPVGRGIGSLGTRAFGKALTTEKRLKALNVAGDIAGSYGTPALMNVAESIATDTPLDPYETLYQGTSNVAISPVAKRTLGRLFGKRGNIGTITGAFSEKTPEVEKQTFKSFEKGLDKAIKERKKIAGNVSQNEAFVSMSPKQRATMENVKPVFSGDPQLDETATEIAKIVGKKGVSLEKATQIYFDNLSKKKSPAYVESIVERMNERKNKVFDVGEGGKIFPNKNLYDLIDESSWGEVFTKEFAKAGRAKKPSFTKKYLLGEMEGVTDPDYINWLKNKASETEKGKKIGKSLADVVPFVDVSELEKEKEEERKKEAERLAMQRYIFGME